MSNERKRDESVPRPWKMLERSSDGSCGRDYQDCDDQSLSGRHIVMKISIDITMSKIRRILLKHINLCRT